MRPDYSVFSAYSPAPYDLSAETGRQSRTTPLMRGDPEVKSALAAGMQRLDTIRPRPPPLYRTTQLTERAGPAARTD